MGKIVRVRTLTQVGASCIPVDVEATIRKGLRKFIIVGLPDGIVREAKERVRCAIEQSLYNFPSDELIVSLAPAALPKIGAGFDLAIALSILAADGMIDSSKLLGSIFQGELSLDGNIKSTGNGIASALAARDLGAQKIYLGLGDASRGSFVGNMPVYAATSLQELVEYLRGNVDLKQFHGQELGENLQMQGMDFSFVCGQEEARRAMEISATGHHHILMIGSPGGGKSMLAQCLPSIMPEMHTEEWLESCAIYEIWQQRVQGNGIQEFKDKTRPCRSPHHTISASSLIGGGNYPTPGEISLAHNGVLFLDEFAEFKKTVLDSLREPLENKFVHVTRAMVNAIFPANFLLVGAMNPPSPIANNKRRISMPLLDRMDLQLRIEPIFATSLIQAREGESSASIAQRVSIARDRQMHRQGKLNSSLSTQELSRVCKLGRREENLLEKASQRFKFSSRAVTKTLKIGRTIADLEGSTRVSIKHIAEALSYRVDSGGGVF